MEEYSPNKLPSGIQELENYIDDSHRHQLEYEKFGNYETANQCKSTVASGKKELERRRLAQMGQRHKQEREELDNAHSDQVNQFENFWNGNKSKQEENAAKSLSELKARHEDEVRDTIQELERSLPNKIKESAEMLNLRKMEQNMAKQKRYEDAHLVQARIAELMKLETAQWDRQRKIKIQTKVDTLESRHQLETAALKKKIGTSLDELRVNRTRQADKLQLKYENIKKDQKAAHEKEQLAFKGEFKSKTSISSTSSGSKSRS